MACSCSEHFSWQSQSFHLHHTLKLLYSLLVHCNNTDCVEVIELKHLMVHIIQLPAHLSTTIIVDQWLHPGGSDCNLQQRGQETCTFTTEFTMKLLICLLE